MPQSLRAPTWSEKLRDKIRSVQSSIAEQPILQFLGKLDSDLSNKELLERNRQVAEEARLKNPTPGWMKKVQASAPMQMLGAYSEAFGDPTDPANWGAHAGNAGIFPPGLIRERVLVQTPRVASKAKNVAAVMRADDVPQFSAALSKLQQTHPRVMSTVEDIRPYAEAANNGKYEAAYNIATDAKYIRDKNFQLENDFKGAIPDSELAEQLTGTSQLGWNTAGSPKDIGRHPAQTAIHENAHVAQGTRKRHVHDSVKWKKDFGGSGTSLNPAEIGADATTGNYLRKRIAKSLSALGMPDRAKDFVLESSGKRSYVNRWIEEANRRAAFNSDDLIDKFGNEVLPDYTKRFGLDKGNERLSVVTLPDGTKKIVRERVQAKAEPKSNNILDLASNFNRGLSRSGTKGDLVKYRTPSIDEQLAQFEIDNPETRGNFWEKEQTKDPNKVLEGEVLPALGGKGKTVRSGVVDNPNFNAVGQSLEDSTDLLTSRIRGELQPALIMPNGEVLKGGDYHDFVARNAGFKHLDDALDNGAKQAFVRNGQLLAIGTGEPIPGNFRFRDVSGPMTGSNPIDRFQRMLQRQQGDAENYRGFTGK